MKISGYMVCLNTALTYLHFALIRDRLHLMRCDTRSEEVHLLLVLNSCSEMLFRVAHYNPIVGLKGNWQLDVNFMELTSSLTNLT